MLSNIKSQKEGKEFFDEETVKVFIAKNCWNKYLARNLFPAKPGVANLLHTMRQFFQT